MKNVKLMQVVGAAFMVAIGLLFYNSSLVEHDEHNENLFIPTIEKKSKKTPEDQMRFAEERMLHERNMQINPATGELPVALIKEERALGQLELNNAMSNRSAAASTSYISRGPSNLGGRTRAVKVDISDPTGNTLLAAGISSGIFRTTDGGSSWVKTTANSEIYNASSLAQDPRPGFQNIWYYGTGEAFGNSANLNGSPYRGNGIYQSTDNGVTWQIIAGTDSDFTQLDSDFDFVYNLAVSPVTGDLLAATWRGIRRYDGTNWSNELNDNSAFTDVVYTATGVAYAAFNGNAGNTINGVWRSTTGNGNWNRVAANGDPLGWSSAGRCVLAAASSNPSIVYAMFMNGNSGIDADFWKYDDSTGDWTDFTSKMPDEPGGDLAGNDPFTGQGGYDLVISVKPTDENFVLIGGTNAYRIESIESDPEFERIGGYRNRFSYALYDLGGGDQHHPDVHAYDFDPLNPDILYSGTDGGVHRTSDINATTIAWENINNNYQTYQFYHTEIDPLVNSDIVVGGAQDNGTVVGGLDAGNSNATEMFSFIGGDGVAVDISRDNPACGGGAAVFAGFQLGPIFRSCNSFVEITPESSTSQFVTYFKLDDRNPTNLYYAGRNRLFATSDASNVTSSTWENKGTTSVLGATDFFVRFNTSPGDYDPNSSYLLAGGDEGLVLRIDDPVSNNIAGAEDITPPTVSRVFPTIVTGLAVHPSNPDIVMLTYSNYGIENIFLTTNATSDNPDWTVVERNLAAYSIRSAMITEVDGETRYFVGTARGLFATSDPTSADWEMQAPDLIGMALVSDLDYRQEDQQLLIGTHGNGMFMATVAQELSIEEFNAGELASIKMFPNPATSIINLEASMDLSESAYRIVNLSGKTIQQGTLSLDNQVDVSSLSAGVYFLSLGNNTKTLKFIKK